MNNGMDPNKIIEVEWHQLDLRYQSLRIHTDSAVRSLMLSIHIHGLLMPITVIASGVKDYPWVVIDGYLRVLALKALGHDLVQAVVCQLAAAEALLHIYQHNRSRTWDAFEEANLLQELLTTHQYPQGKLAQLLGRSEAWICHRLQLLTQLPDFVQKAVALGVLSSWVASRILVPFARANAQHAEQFVAYLCNKPHTSREIQSFYEQYLCSNKKTRETLISNPAVFFKLQGFDKLESSRRYTELSPEYTWDLKCAQILDCLRVLDSIMSAVFYPQQSAQESQGLIDKFHKICTRIESLQHLLEETVYARTTNSAAGEAIAASR